MKYVDVRDLPPCSYSPECLRLIDDLDVPATAYTPARLSHIDDLHDRRRLRQLRSHVPGCPTCSALLDETRRMRSQQRLMLHHFLLANEKQVPSTAGAIFAAIQREQALSADEASQERYIPLSDEALLPLFAEVENAPVSEPTLLSARSFHHRLFLNVLTLATIAAVILAAIGLLNRFVNPPSATTPSEPVPHSPAQPNLANNHGWNTAVIGLALISASGFTIYSFNAVSGQMTTLFDSTENITGLNMEGISGDGQSVLYDVVSSDQQKTYETFSPMAQSQKVYRLSSREGGNAIWMDEEHVLIQTQGHVLELDTRTDSLLENWPVQASSLAFYDQPFLYFTGAVQLNPDALYRINLKQSNAQPQKIAQSSPNTRFWLSSDGTKIFFANQGAGSAEGIYSVSSDGSHLNMFRPGSGLPIGYADDNSLLLLQQVGMRLEVIKMGATPEEQEKVVLSNAAPGATSLCEPAPLGMITALCNQDIALEPYGHGLLLHAYYADGSHSLVYDNLAAGTSQKIFSLGSGVNVQLPGWSKISAGTTGLVSSLAQCA